MSESVNRGVATVVAGGCMAMLKTSAKAAHQAVTDMIDNMSEASQRDYEYLLSVAPTAADEVSACATEARQQVSERMDLLKDHIASSGYQLADQGILPIVALSQSSLGQVVSSHDWQVLAANQGDSSFQRLLEQSSATFAQSQYQYVLDAVIEVAENEGFTSPRTMKISEKRAVVSLADRHGRGVIAKLSRRESGPTVDLDLSGYNGDGCHEAMNRLLAGLAAKDITLHQSVRQRHVTLDRLSVPKGKGKRSGEATVVVSTTDEREKQAALRLQSQVRVAPKIVEGR